MDHHDTIVAPITATGGAVAVVRVSGDQAWEVAKTVAQASPRPGRAQYVRYLHGDDGLATLFPAGRSYTGEETAELSCHGSPAAVRALVEACVRAGARLAGPGEFSLRAFMAGRLDLTQAEGVRDLVAARTQAQLRQAGLLREGKLLDYVSKLRDSLIGAIATVEASVDFSDEVGEPDREAIATTLSEALETIEALLASGVGARIVREGFSVAIAGLPNAGKSSLFNAVLGADRAIVTALPGTTRDTLEETLELDGLAVRLLDTAGLRESPDEAESLGVARARETTAQADAVWYVYDRSAGWSENDRLPDRPTILIANKADLPAAANQPEGALAVSATTGAGILALLTATVALAGSQGADGLVNRRHVPLLEEAASAVREARHALVSEAPYDLATVCMRSAVRALGEITGETASPDIVARVFRDFCVGK